MASARDRGEALSNVDAAWLRMEDSTNLMTITAVMSFYDKLDFAVLKELVEDRLLPYDRFRQRVVESPLPFGGPRWAEDDNFNLRAHLQRVALPDPGGQNELQEMVSTLMSTPLDPTKPLWQMQYIENYRGGSAVVIRIHHCIADGIALVRVMFGMTDDSPGGGPRSPRRRQRRGRQLGGGFWLPEVVNDALYSVRKVTGQLVDEGLERVLDPARTAELARQGVRAAGVLQHLVTMPSDPDTVFGGRLGTAKRCAWSQILPLDEVKDFGKAHGATINDVLLSGVAGALRRYMVQRGQNPDGLTLRAVVPVNLRPDDEIGELGNKFGLVFLGLPIGLASRAERLAELKRRMGEIKSSSEAIVTYALLNAVGMAGPEVEGLAVQIFGSKATAVMTNVPGPRQELYFAGHPMRSMMFWVPQSARLGLGVSILSYAGQVRLGVATDAGLVPDPESIIAAFQSEMENMISGGEEAATG
jgi:WS/DGAT/MGAT family acyltransferase